MEKIKIVRKSSGKKQFTSEITTAHNYDMIVFCHLRWQFVYQRPQHIISRMAKELKILFIEEPVSYKDSEENTATVMVISEHLHILQPKVKNIEAIADVLARFLKNRHIPVGWFYSASFSPLLQALTFETVVYDCMDELALFKNAPQELIDQEKYLVAHADIVFTGGKSLYESKNKMHNNVFCFPSSVDESHFATALEDQILPEDIGNIPSPIVGFYGVIDERIDLLMLQEAAANMPEVSFVMIGPLAKINESELPRAQNIYYLGMKSYNQLPVYLKAFDIAMMPFAINDATKYISPTKTLEYMAAGKPIISTKITDVLRDYSCCVSFVENASEFCTKIGELLRTKDSLSIQMEYYEILKKTSWDATANTMKTLVKNFAK